MWLVELQERATKRNEMNVVLSNGFGDAANISGIVTIALKRVCGGAKAWLVTSLYTQHSRLSPGVASGRGDASPVSTPKYEKVGKIFDRQYHSPSKVLKLEDDPWGSCAMYSPEKMKSGGGLMAPPGCFPGRYSPTYRTTDPRRCVPNPSVAF
ncbi:unnamed protein product [Leptidea sinapis]|uniref:Uncharacterized protein n=1 Tax=Leptidea sinapis TaxID=189913 RepID=A0A5E4PMB9_9NEOP|nr:unnamed protein product [Leptidea sinapis]